MRTCLSRPGKVMSKGWASSLMVAGPRASRSRMWRRVGSDSAEKVRSSTEYLTIWLTVALGNRRGQRGGVLQNVDLPTRQTTAEAASPSAGDPASGYSRLTVPAAITPCTPSVGPGRLASAQPLRHGLEMTRRQQPLPALLPPAYWRNLLAW